MDDEEEEEEEEKKKKNRVYELLKLNPNHGSAVIIKTPQISGFRIKPLDTEFSWEA